MLPKSLDAPNMERKSTDFMNKREVVSTFFVKQQLQSAWNLLLEQGRGYSLSKVDLTP